MKTELLPFIAEPVAALDAASHDVIEHIDTAELTPDALDLVLARAPMFAELVRRAGYVSSARS